MVRLKGLRFHLRTWPGNTCPQTSHTLLAVGTRSLRRLMPPWQCISYRRSGNWNVALTLIYCLLLEPAASAVKKRDCFKSVGS